MGPQAKGRQESPEAGRCAEAHTAFGWAVALPTPGLWTSGLRNWERINVILSNTIRGHCFQQLTPGVGDNKKNMEFLKGRDKEGIREEREVN